MKLPHLLLLISLTLFGSCNRGINDASKRNENWLWWQDSNGESKWIARAETAVLKTGKFTNFYSNGKLFSNGKLKDGKGVDTTYYYTYEGIVNSMTIYMHDTSYVYYPINGNFKALLLTGELETEGIVTNHQPGDKWTQYYKNGIVAWREIFENGTGWATGYYESGQLKDSTHFSDNLLDGLSMSWSQFGQLQTIIHNKRGKWDGELITYDENGGKASKGNFKDGLSIGNDSIWYPNGQLRFVRPNKNGARNGRTTEYFDDGHLKATYEFKDGIQAGETREYYRNGQLKSRGYYENNKQVGKSVSYTENGRIQIIFNYDKGILDGEQSLFYSNGELGSTGIIRNGKLERPWHCYDSLGKEINIFPPELKVYIKDYLDENLNR